MGVRQSRRSVDITTTPKKEGAPAEGGVGDAAAPGDGKLERIEETDTKPTTNGIAPHTDVTEDKDDATEKEKEKEKDKKKEKEKVRLLDALHFLPLFDRPSPLNRNPWPNHCVSCLRIER